MRVAIVGATGIAGQQFVDALRDHPWFEITALAASERSAGKSYGDALRDAKTGARALVVRRGAAGGDPRAAGGRPATRSISRGVDVVFSAIESEPARELEPRWARLRPVFSTASAFRYEDDVPLLIPGVNLAHAPLLRAQRTGRGWKGFVAPIPNCTTTGLGDRARSRCTDVFGVEKVAMTSMQGMSGAGRSPGVVALDILDNVVPYIVGEEEKVAKETAQDPRRARRRTSSTAAPMRGVGDLHARRRARGPHRGGVGHRSRSRARRPTPPRPMRAYDFGIAALPSAPRRVHHGPRRPVPPAAAARSRRRRRHDDVGRPVASRRALAHGLRFVLVSHNTKMGAAKGAVLLAEALRRDGYL